MQPSQDLSSSYSPSSGKPDVELLALMYKAGMISASTVYEVLGANREAMTNRIVEDTYEEKRERMLELCRTEVMNFSLHNDIVAELLQYITGDDPAFGSLVGEIYEYIESHPLATVSQVTFDLMTTYISPKMLQGRF